MVTSDDVVLRHARAPYDPVKRREYYLRTRELKGRRPAGSRPQSSGSRTTRAVSGSAANSVRTAQQARRIKRRKEVQVRIDALNARLEKLRTVLRELVEQAKKRSGVEPAQKDSTQTKKAEPAGSKKKTEPTKQTATEKRKSAERSKDYYEKNIKGKNKLSLSQEEAVLKANVKEVEKKIIAARAKLKTSVANARDEVVSTKPAAKRRRPSLERPNQNGSRL